MSSPTPNPVSTTPNPDPASNDDIMNQIQVQRAQREYDAAIKSAYNQQKNRADELQTKLDRLTEANGVLEARISQQNIKISDQKTAFNQKLQDKSMEFGHQIKQLQKEASESESKIIDLQNLVLQVQRERESECKELKLKILSLNAELGESQAKTSVLESALTEKDEELQEARTRDQAWETVLNKYEQSIGAAGTVLHREFQQLIRPENRNPRLEIQHRRIDSPIRAVPPSPRSQPSTSTTTNPTSTNPIRTTRYRHRIQNLRPQPQLIEDSSDDEHELEIGEDEAVEILEERRKVKDAISKVLTSTQLVWMFKTNETKSYNLEYAPSPQEFRNQLLKEINRHMNGGIYGNLPSSDPPSWWTNNFKDYKLSISKQGGSDYYSLDIYIKLCIHIMKNLFDATEGRKREIFHDLLTNGAPQQFCNFEDEDLSPYLVEVAPVPERRNLRSRSRSRR